MISKTSADEARDYIISRLPDDVVLTYLAEGAANVVYSLSFSPERVKDNEVHVLKGMKPPNHSVFVLRRFELIGVVCGKVMQYHPAL